MEQLCKNSVNIRSIKDTVGGHAIYLCVYLLLSSESPALLAGTAAFVSSSVSIGLLFIVQHVVALPCRQMTERGKFSDRCSTSCCSAIKGVAELWQSSLHLTP